MKTYGAHIPEPELVQIARDGGNHPHCDDCACCREQLAQIRQMLEDVAPPQSAEGAQAKPFRLAAQGAAPAVEETRWRQTWYLEDGGVVLRVVENHREDLLVGYLLCDSGRLPGLRVRFSGIDEDFLPDAEGRFVIGPSSIEIEPMSVRLM